MTVLFYVSPKKSEEVNLHLRVSPHVILVNYLISLIRFQNVKITDVQLQNATANFRKCVMSTVTVLIYTGKCNINAEAHDDGEYNLKVRV
jgi:hypothetical protein